MSDVMFYGVLRMPYEMTMSSELSRCQFYGRAQEAADRIEAADAKLADLAQELEISQLECGQAVTANAELRDALAARPVVAGLPDALSDERIMDFANKNFSLIFEPPEAIQFARDIESHSPAFAVVQPAPPAHEKDLLDIVRSLVCAVDRKAQVGENYPSPTAEGSSLMIAARHACVERGFTAGGLSVDGAAPADAGSPP